MLAACCLGVVVSWCLSKEVNVVGRVLVALEQFFDGGIGRHVGIFSKDGRWKVGEGSVVAGCGKDSGDTEKMESEESRISEGRGFHTWLERVQH